MKKNKLDNFFKPLTKQELAEGQDEIDRYNKKELEHARCGEEELTGEKLIAIVEAQAKLTRNNNTQPGANDEQKEKSKAPSKK